MRWVGRIGRFEGKVKGEWSFVKLEYHSYSTVLTSSFQEIIFDKSKRELRQDKERKV